MPIFVLLKITSKLKTSKGCGLDGISIKVIKILCQSNAFVTSLSAIINMSFSSGKFPSKWKEARVLPIHRSVDQENVDNYRPVSVLNCLSKISERLVFNTIYAFLVKENLLYKLQSGFRHHHSTATALIQFIDTIYNDFDNHDITGALSLDLRKAFDTVHHKILLDKFKWFNPSEKLLAWMSS